jgi:hypothetical protein
MASPFLGLNIRDGTTPQARRYVNATASAVGVSFGSLDVLVANPQQCAQNRIIQFGGDDNTWVATTHNGIYRTANAGASWTLVQTLNLIQSNSQFKSGLYPVDIAGVPALAMYYFTTTATEMRSYHSFDGITWIAGGPYALGVSIGPSINTGFRNELLFNNTIYMVYAGTQGDNGYILRYSPGASSVSATFIDTNQGNCRSVLVPWNGSLYFLKGFIGGGVFLYDVTAGGFTIVATMPQSGVASTSNPHSQHWTAFVDPATGDLCCAFYVTTAEGWQFVRVASGSFALTNVTATVRHITLSGTNAGGNSPINSGMRASVDEEGNPGAVPAVGLYYSANQSLGTAMTMFQWNGFDSVITVLDTGGNATHALGIANRGGLGPLTWTASTLRVRPISWTGQAVQGGVRFNYRLYGPLGTEAVKVRVYRRTAAQPHTRFPCTLRSPSAVQVERFFTSGSWVAPTGVTSVTVECWGGGGGGRGDHGGATSQGGGGGGAYARSVLAVTPGNSYAYVVGGGGQGGAKDTVAGGPTAAQDGGDTHFIDAATVMAKGGRGRDSSSQTGALGGLASASVGTIKFDGGQGGNGAGGDVTGTGGGGGATGGTTANGQTGTLTVPGYAQFTIEGGHGGNGGLGAPTAGVIPGGGGGSSGQQAETSFAAGAAGALRLTYVNPAVSQGTLSLNEMEIENLVADNGLSTFSVIVALEDDGVPNATPGALVLDVVAA